MEIGELVVEPLIAALKYETVEVGESTFGILNNILADYFGEMMQVCSGVGVT